MNMMLVSSICARMKIGSSGRGCISFAPSPSLAPNTFKVRVCSTDASRMNRRILTPR